jgi:phosphopantothenoylcysteine decarboxylase / phosphopantothenate---cysteine ligase
MGESILVGVTGGIAAYKTPALVRAFTSAGRDVHVVTTRSATKFVSPLVLATLSGNPVHTSLWAKRNTPSVAHITLADRAAVAVVAPATANILAKLAWGICDDLLTTVLAAVTCPVLLCPSMNVNMFRRPAVQRNLEILKELGYRIAEPETGWLACGWTGPGRMPEPEEIAERTLLLVGPHDLKGERILVTAGPTEEPIDPVRVLTNRSSGKMGVAVARRAAMRGAEVTLVAGPLKVKPPVGVKTVSASTALDMQQKVMDLFPAMDAVVKAAAVSDFRPASLHPHKIKKNEPMFGSIALTQNPDILRGLGEIKRPEQILIGFAAETHDPEANARKKLIEKRLDMLVLNDVSKEGAGFDGDTNIVRFLYPDGREEQTGLLLKEAVADLILDRLKEMRLERTA